MSKQGNISVGQIVSELALQEGKKVEVSVGNIREVVALLSDLIYDDLRDFSSWEGGERGIVSAFYQNGARRAKRKKR